MKLNAFDCICSCRRRPVASNFLPVSPGLRQLDPALSRPSWFPYWLQTQNGNEPKPQMQRSPSQSIDNIVLQQRKKIEIRKHGKKKTNQIPKP